MRYSNYLLCLLLCYINLYLYGSMSFNYNKRFDVICYRMLMRIRQGNSRRSVEDLKTNLYHDLRVIRDRSSKPGLNNYLILNYRMFSNTTEVTKQTLFS